MRITTNKEQQSVTVNASSSWDEARLSAAVLPLSEGGMFEDFRKALTGKAATKLVLSTSEAQLLADRAAPHDAELAKQLHDAAGELTAAAHREARQRKA